jgi:hypothetical protein
MIAVKVGRPPTVTPAPRRSSGISWVPTRGLANDGPAPIGSRTRSSLLTDRGSLRASHLRVVFGGRGARVSRPLSRRPCPSTSRCPSAGP